MCENDGGYYALKGFLYQFDKTIIELLNNKEEDTFIYMEKIQDINYENYIIQVKHKEESKFSNSKIKEPIIQLLDLYKKDKDRKLYLYGYFNDRKPEEFKFSDTSELDKVILYRDGEKNRLLNDKFTEDIKKGFIENFTLCFAENYAIQFQYTINLIKSVFLLKSNDDAIIYHSLIREKLLELSIIKDKEKRKISKLQLKSYVINCNKNIFYGYYDMVLGRENYIKLIKKKYFTDKSVNINNFERLFIIDCNSEDNETIIRKIIDVISSKYYRKNKSPAPYICFKNISREKLLNIKRDMLDDGVNFSDGTYFDGDIFRAEKLRKDLINNISVKIISDVYLDEMVEEVTFKEIYNLFIEKPTQIKTRYSNIMVQVNELDEIKNMIA